ncbi:hypothetical protein CEY12_19730 [Chryseobacterium sp. T16E-39]|uniref:hypothetical protein n=1 Tax=Chryseobacterium sp. T16E-39 TaxID=2015076 RepID=UPI000B5B1E47|nr:hypothetical protein [Chryseobacterium sp. T16E-39]ASK32182.1 hypothetical protein CEY12_19730 [Chryseobacterium sp. T16E-39]
MLEQKDFIVVPFMEIKSRFGLHIQDYSSDLFLSNNPTDEAVYPDPATNTFAVYEGDTTMDELDLTILGYGLEQPQNRAILVIGNLHINHHINMYGTDVGYPICLYVTGNLTAENVVMSSLSDIVVRGNIEIIKDFYAINTDCGYIACGGNFNAMNAYVESFSLTVQSTLNVPNFYYHVNLSRNDIDASLDELSISIHQLGSSKPVACGESGIKYFDLMEDIENGDLDFDHMDQSETDKINALYRENFVFKPQFYSKHNEFDLSNIAYKEILKGENIFA